MLERPLFPHEYASLTLCQNAADLPLVVVGQWSTPPPPGRIFVQRMQTGETVHVGTLKLLLRPRGSVSNGPRDREPI